MTEVIERPPRCIRSGLEPLSTAIHHRLKSLPGPAAAASIAAQCLREYQPGPGILSPGEQAGSADHYQQHVLHVDDEIGFSIVALVWRAGQRTTIHDHLCWGAVAVLRGAEHESLYTLVGDSLIGQVRRINPVGDVSSFLPPGDIHYVCNPGPETAISLHVYGVDINARGSSIRRNYDLRALAA
jgi:predicted metal-dependent enzyme (double-stranded beta helix superfamily)